MYHNRFLYYGTSQIKEKLSKSEFYHFMQSPSSIPQWQLLNIPFKALECESGKHFACSMVTPIPDDNTVNDKHADSAARKWQGEAPSLHADPLINRSKPYNYWKCNAAWINKMMHKDYLKSCWMHVLGLLFMRLCSLACQNFEKFSGYFCQHSWNSEEWKDHIHIIRHSAIMTGTTKTEQKNSSWQPFVIFSEAASWSCTKSIQKLRNEIWV